MTDDKPYVQIVEGEWFGYHIELIDNRRGPGRGGRAERVYWSKWFSFTFDKAKARGLRKLAKYNALLERERKAWKVTS